MNQSLFIIANNRILPSMVLLHVKQGKRAFLGCSAYPRCDYLRPLQRSEHKVLKHLMKFAEVR